MKIGITKDLEDKIKKHKKKVFDIQGKRLTNTQALDEISRGISVNNDFCQMIVNDIEK
jgi:hypothetical protein